MMNYLKNWNVMRLLRLALGIFAIVQGVQTAQWFLVAMGGIFSIIPLLNIGCSGVSGCTVPISKSSKKVKDIDYEEVR